ncbi:MAG: response regulator transcription factor [Hymenobacter sp.]|nr:response regulator transcription factor [Hymenobacter sp.]
MLNVLAIDDEPLALRVIAAHAKKVPFVHLVGTTTNPVEGLLQVQQGGIDVVLLDVQMATMTGFQFLQILQGQCPVILTTAYPQYALEGYEYAVADYLLKPISFERFLKAVQRVHALQADPAAAAPAPETAGFIFIKTDTRLLKTNHADICYIVGGKEYATVVTPNGKILTLTSLAKLAEALPPTQFMRVHKSYIVALDKIQTVERQRIYLANTIIPIGDTYRAGFAKVLGSGS